MSKKYLIGTIAGIVLIALAVGISLVLVPHSQAQANTTVAAGLHDVVQQVTTTGQVEATDTTNLAFGVGGVLKTVLVKKGDTVQAGQTIATLDATDTAALVAAAQATVTNSQSTTDVTLQDALASQKNTAKVNAAAVAAAKQKILNAKATLATAQDIFNNVDSDSDIDKTSVTYITAAQSLVSAKAAYNDAQQSYQNAQAQSQQSATVAANAINSAMAANHVSVDKAQLAYQSAVLNKSVLRAPSTGTITTTDLEVGQYAAPGQKVATLMSPTLQITAQVSQADIAQLKPDMTANITLDALGSQVFTARIVSIDPAATDTNGVASYGVTLEFTNASDQIKTGMTANITIPTTIVTQTLAVPNQAIVMDGPDAFVFRPAEGTKGSQKQAVKIGLKGTNGFTQILSGLNAGDQVISFGTQASN